MKAKKIFTIISISFLSLLLITLAIVFIYTNSALKSVKNLDVTLTNKEQNYSEIYDAYGNELKYTENLKDNYISLDNIPDYTKQAFISIEDKNFYNHKGLNYKRIAKATLNNLKSKSLKEGASTITQQLVKNRFLTNEKTLDRKIKEAYLSKKLEKNETKDKILETYLNTIYFGNGAYGIGNASKTFFNKSPNELTLSESCVLAGCIKSPKNYSPLNNLEKATERRNLVLSEMLKDNKITEIEYNQAIAESIDTSNSNLKNSIESLDLYSQFVLKEASEILNTNISNILYGGYKIYTNQDYSIQEKLDEILSDEKNYHKNRNGNIADSLAIVIDNDSRAVLAIGGKSKYSLVDIKRQPGSLIKPILTFAPAINEGLINSKTQILDEEINIDGYTPNNVGNNYYGYISVEDVVAKSLNIPTIKTTVDLGLDKCLQYAKKCGIEFNDKCDNNLAVALGGFTDGVTLKEITDSYSVLTNNGNYSKSNFINKITNQQNTIIYNRLLSETNVYDTDTPYLMTDILKYSVKNGTSKKLSKFNFDVAGKTGTVAVKGTNYNTDAYSLAYTTKNTMSVWLGDYSMQKEYYLEGKNNGGTYCTQMICDMFEYLYKNNSPANFEQPDTVTKINIDKRTLDEDHKITLGDNVPSRYQIECLVSNRFIPTEESTKFNTITPFDFNITTYKNSCEISFEAKDYLEYKIYRKGNGKYQLLTTINNIDGIATYIDKNMEFGVDYTYYIQASSQYSDAKFDTSKKSTKITKKYDNIIKNNSIEKDNISWLFS